MVQLAVLPLALYLPLLLVSVLTAPISMGLFVRSLVRRHPRALWSMTALFCICLTVLLLSGAIAAREWIPLTLIPI